MRLPATLLPAPLVACLTVGGAPLRDDRDRCTAPVSLLPRAGGPRRLELPRVHGDRLVLRLELAQDVAEVVGEGDDPARLVVGRAARAGLSEHGPGRRARRHAAARLPLLYRQWKLFADVLLAQAEEALSSSEAAYTTGKLNALDLLDAEHVLFEVRTATARTRADHAITLAELEGAIAQPIHIGETSDEE